MLDRAVIDALFPADLPGPGYWEERYPPRLLPASAEVTRFGPSPTGFVHIGGVYVATIDRDLAAQSGGSYLVRVEDTDQSREVEGALAQFGRAFDYFGLRPDESDGGAYGPYRQSARHRIYLTYVRELLRRGQRTRASPPRRSSPRSPPGSKLRRSRPATTGAGRPGVTPIPPTWPPGWPAAFPM